MKSVVIISGSGRNGNTLGIAKVYAGEFEKNNFFAKIIDLSSLKISFCDGCLSCDETQKCKINDGFGAIIEEIRSSNLVVFGTPARWRLLSGELKCFIDRLNPYAAVEGYSGIRAFVYALGQSSMEDGTSIINAIDSVCSFATDAGMDVLGKQAFYELYDVDDYLKNIDVIKEICQSNVKALCEEIK